MEHELKIPPRYFAEVVSGVKTFEVRDNDRDFQQGDTVMLREFDPTSLFGYTNRFARYAIGFVTSYEQKPGFVVFSLLPRPE